MRTTRFGGLDALGIDDSGAGAGMAAGSFPVSFHQLVVHACPGAFVTEAGEPAISRLMRREMLRQHAPGTATAQLKENRIDNLAHRPAALAAGLGRLRELAPGSPIRRRSGRSGIAGYPGHAVPGCRGSTFGAPRRSETPLNSPVCGGCKPSRYCFETASEPLTAQTDRTNLYNPTKSLTITMQMPK